MKQVDGETDLYQSSATRWTTVALLWQMRNRYSHQEMRKDFELEFVQALTSAGQSSSIISTHSTMYEWGLGGERTAPSSI